MHVHVGLELNGSTDNDLLRCGICTFVHTNTGSSTCRSLRVKAFIRGEGEEVIERSIDPQVADESLIQQSLWQSVAELYLLDLEIRAIFDHGIRNGILVHVVGTGARHRGIGMIGSPAVVIEIILHLVPSEHVRTVDTAEHVIALRTCTKEREVKSLVGSGERDAIGDRRNAVTDVGQIILCDLVVAVEIIELWITGLGVDTFELIATEVVNRIALLKEGDVVGMELRAGESG